MHEIITLQFGQQANYLGTHYWNTQESYFTYAGEADSPVDHDISFRAGLAPDGSDTYTPRTVIYDLKGAFGTLRQENALYELQQQDRRTLSNVWSRNTVPLQLDPIAPSAYQQALDHGGEPPRLTTETVRFWSDYNHLFYHPKSIVQLNEYELHSSLMPFEQWQNGEELFVNLDREQDLLDRDLRPFLEDCDQLQAIQVFTGTDDAWGGFASRYLERISDELGKGCRWVFGLNSGLPTNRERALMRTANSAQSMFALDSVTSVHIPITTLPYSLPRYANLDASSAWMSSALQTTVIEGLTLPTRLRRTDTASATFDQLEATLNDNGHRRLAIAGLSAEDPSNLRPVDGRAPRLVNGFSHAEDSEKSSKTDINMFFNDASAPTNVNRQGEKNSHIFSRVECLRGDWRSAEEVEEAGYATHNRFASGPRTSIHQTQLLFPLLSSFPHIFNFENRPDKLAIRTDLSTSNVVANRIRHLSNVSRGLIGVEEREALCDDLTSMAEEYEEGWSGSDDSDDND